MNYILKTFYPMCILMFFISYENNSYLIRNTYIHISCYTNCKHHFFIYIIFANFMNYTQIYPWLILAKYEIYSWFILGILEYNRNLY